MSKLTRRALLQAGIAGTVASSFRASAQSPSSTGKAKRLLFIFQAGGPSQLESFDYKPGLAALRGTDLPGSVLAGRPISTMTSGGRLLVANSLVGFKQYGQSGMWVSDLFPHIASVVDDFCLIKSMNATPVNHDPATNLMLTGSEVIGRPSLGAWVSYGMGSSNANLPSFVTLASQSKVQFVQPVSKRLWSSAFLPVAYSGVSLRPGAQPVLYLDDERGLPQASRRELFERVAQLNEQRFVQTGDPEILRRNDAYEVAASMLTSVPELADESGEPESVYEMYGPQAKTPGSFAANCLRARRLLERDVRCVMLSHRGWDAHYNVTKEMTTCALDTDQPTAALLKDLKSRGLLDDTLVVWGGEFGRTPFSQGEITAADHGRDHNPYCFPMLMAGAGIKAGTIYGETDDFSLTVTKDPVGVHDLHATMLHLLGLDQWALSYKHDGRDFRLTDLGGTIITGILS
jgi:Protein of unknown function (DUF1501)